MVPVKKTKAHIWCSGRIPHTLGQPLTILLDMNPLKIPKHGFAIPTECAPYYICRPGPQFAPNSFIENLPSPCWSFVLFSFCSFLLRVTSRSQRLYRSSPAADYSDDRLQGKPQTPEHQTLAPAPARMWIQIVSLHLSLIHLPQLRRHPFNSPRR